MKKQELLKDWNEILLMGKCTPYVFRTRLERIINKTQKYSEQVKDKELNEAGLYLLEKLKYISDQSNQTSDGCLNSFIVLKDDIIKVRENFL